jgi:hypothetical protein
MNDVGVWIGFGLAGIVALVLVVAGFKIADDTKRQQWLNLVFVVGGGLAGWTAGVLMTPLGPDEARRFSELGLGITALAGGFIATKVIEALAKKIESGLDSAFIGSAALFLFSFLLGGLSTFIWRTYMTVSGS